MNHNCPNCGAPIKSIECPYCGTVLYDFAALYTDRPTYVKLKHAGQIITLRVLVRTVTIEQQINTLPSVTIEMDSIYFGLERDHYMIVEQEQ